MKLSWTEPWRRNLLRHRVREANLIMPSIRSISFENRDGFHLLVLRCVTKRGKSFERTVVASAKYSDDDVAKFLFDIGMANLWNAGIEV